MENSRITNPAATGGEASEASGGPSPKDQASPTPRTGLSWWIKVHILDSRSSAASPVPRLALFLWMATIVAVAYLPVIQGRYMYHDDYYLQLVSGSCETHPQYRAYTFDYGRPLGIQIKCAYARLFYLLSEANRARAITLVAIALLGFLFLRVLARAGLGTLESLALAGAMITLPGFQTPAVMLANAHHVYAGILGVVAAGYAVKAASWGGPRRGLVAREAGSVALLSAALLVYQPGAFLYMLPVVVALTTWQVSEWRDLARRLFLALLPFALSATGHFIYMKALGTHRGQATTDLAGKILWLRETVLPHVLSFWSLRPRPGLVSAAVWLLALLVVLIGAARLVRGELQWRGLGLAVAQWTVAVGLAAASFLPNLLAVENTFFFRTLIAIQPIALFLVYSGFRHLVRSAAEIIGSGTRLAIPLGRELALSLNIAGSRPLAIGLGRFVAVPLLVCGAAYGVVQAHYNVMNYYVVPLTTELAYIRDSLRKADPARLLHIHVVRPRLPFMTKFHVNDEFGVPTTFFPQDAPWIVLAARRELGLLNPAIRVTTGPDARQYDFPDGTWPVRDLFPVPAGAFVIDMSQIGVRDLNP